MGDLRLGLFLRNQRPGRAGQDGSDIDFLPGDVESDGGFSQPPTVVAIEDGIQFRGKKASGASGKFIYNIGQAAAATVYTMRYDPDWSALANGGVTAMVGFGLRDGNDFHLVGLKGDGSTGLIEHRVHGTPPNGWNKSSGHTAVNGAGAAHGTQAGPNYVQIEIAEDGSTYTFRSSTDGSSFTDEFTDIVPAPFGDTADSEGFGIAVYLQADDAGSFIVDITLWTEEAASGEPDLWTPVELGAALVGWYRGDTLTGSNGDPIATWPDVSGNDDDMTQATSANRPTLETAGLNSLNVVRFTAADSEYMLIPPGIYTGATAASAYLVIKLVADPAAASSSSGLWRIGNETGASASCHFPFTDGNVYDGFASTARKSTGNPTADLSSTYRIAGFHSAANDWGLMVDGVSHFATATNTVGIEGSSTALGRSDDGLGNFFYLDARVAEAVFTNAKQSEADRQKTEGYLAHKWGLTANLDIGHPYESEAPTV